MRMVAMRQLEESVGCPCDPRDSIRRKRYGDHPCRRDTSDSIRRKREVGHQPH